jgi:magnesium-transporting ATPase (P-type)
MSITELNRDYWSLSEEELLRAISSDRDGLSSSEALRRLRHFGPNAIKEQKNLSKLLVLWNQVRSPLLLILAFAAAVSILTQDWGDSLIVIVILIGSVGVGYSREFRAQNAAEKLRARLRKNWLTYLALMRKALGVKRPGACFIPRHATAMPEMLTSATKCSAHRPRRALLPAIGF